MTKLKLVVMNLSSCLFLLVYLGSVANRLPSPPSQICVCVKPFCYKMGYLGSGSGIRTSYTSDCALACFESLALLEKAKVPHLLTVCQNLEIDIIHGSCMKSLFGGRIIDVGYG